MTCAAKTLVGIALAIDGFAWCPSSQPQEEPVPSEIRTRNLWNTAFSSQRPAAPKPPKVAADFGDCFVGLTLWRMRLSKTSDPVRFRGFVHDQDPSGQAEWTPERVALDA